MHRRTPILARSLAAAAALTLLPGRAPAQFTVEQLGALFKAGVRLDAVISTVRAKCLAFRLGPGEEQALAASGASSRDIAQLRGVCVAAAAPTSDVAPAPVPVAAALPADTGFVPDTTWRAVKALETDTTSAEARRNRTLTELLGRGADALRANDLDGAFGAWDEMLRLDPTRLGLLVNRAIEEERAGRLAAAFSTFRRLYGTAPSAGVPPDQVAGWKARGLEGMLWTASRYGARNDRAGQKAALRQVLEIDPGNAVALDNLLALLYPAGEWAELLTFLDRLAELYPLDYDQKMMRYAAYRGLAASGDTGPGAAARYREQAEEAVAGANALPLRLQHVRLEYAGGTATVRGDVTAGSLPPGGSLTLEITYTSPDGVLGRQTASVGVPAAGVTMPFSASMVTPAPPTGVRYRVL